MKARTVENLVFWDFDIDAHILIKDEGHTIWEGECRNIPKKYLMRYVKSMSMRCELYIKNVPEVEYVIVTLFAE